MQRTVAVLIHVLVLSLVAGCQSEDKLIGADSAGRGATGSAADGPAAVPDAGGMDGSAGPEGVDGPAGAEGVDASAGSEGVDGPAGPEGMDASADTTGSDPPYDSTMSFFVTSRGGPKGGDFRQNDADTDGLAGADAFCKELAAAVRAELGNKTWRAYLSTSTVDARSRIGKGPWYNAQMIVVAESLEQLHEEGGLMNNLVVGEFINIRDENGLDVPADRHDILTGSTAAGLKDPDDNHCDDWTSIEGEAAVGYADRKGDSSSSWNAASTAGCAPAPMMEAKLGNRVEGTVSSGGGRGSIFCFAARPGER
jgi:hypothetical protein